MRIVSQARDISINFERCEIRRYGNIIARRDRENEQVLGEYRTAERAAEVFEDIHRAYAPVYSVSNNMTDEEVRHLFVGSDNIRATNIISFQYDGDRDITTYSDYVYYMPEE